MCYDCFMCFDFTGSLRLQALKPLLSIGSEGVEILFAEAMKLQS